MVENTNILKHQGLVLSIARNFNPKDDADLQEYVSEGNIALLRALRKYKSKKGKLSTFAWKYITRAISKHVVKHNKIVSREVSLENILSTENTQSLDLWEILPDNLDDVENTIITKRWNGYTFEEIATEFGHSKSWAKQKFDNIIIKIQNANK